MAIEDIDAKLFNVANLIAKSKNTVVFTGAGVSTESGIPDFRSPGGIWSKYDPEDFTYQKFLSSSKARKIHWEVYSGGNLLSDDIKPNPAHYAITELDSLGKLDCVITQNIDNLHQEAGVPDNKVFQLHGSKNWVTCLNCRMRYPMREIAIRVSQKEHEPNCNKCGGILKPDVVFFGESLPYNVLTEAIDRSEHCDLFIVIGSSLVVYPAASMPIYAVEAGADLVIINLSSTSMDSYAKVIIRSMAGESMPKIVENLKSRIA